MFRRGQETCAERVLHPLPQFCDAGLVVKERDLSAGVVDEGGFGVDAEVAVDCGEDVLGV